jgi:hypothetical protein
MQSPGWLVNWLERHQTRVSFGLHAVGIPLTIAAVVLAGVQLLDWRWDLWWRPALLLTVGYLLQYAGHLYEGNDMGEVILVKRWLGRPYVAVAPRFAKPQPAADGVARPAGPRD